MRVGASAELLQIAEILPLVPRGAQQCGEMLEDFSIGRLGDLSDETGTKFPLGERLQAAYQGQDHRKAMAGRGPAGQNVGGPHQAPLLKIVADLEVEDAQDDPVLVPCHQETSRPLTTIS